MIFNENLYQYNLHYGISY